MKWTLDEWANTLKCEDKVLATLSSFPALITRTICVSNRVYKLCDTEAFAKRRVRVPDDFVSSEFGEVASKALTVVYKVAK